VTTSPLTSTGTESLGDGFAMGASLKRCTSPGTRTSFVYQTSLQSHLRRLKRTPLSCRVSTTLECFLHFLQVIPPLSFQRRSASSSPRRGQRVEPFCVRHAWRLELLRRCLRGLAQLKMGRFLPIWVLVRWYQLGCSLCYLVVGLVVLVIICRITTGFWGRTKRRGGR
jgi:hypothetical protein